LIELGDGAVVSLVLKHDLHRFAALERDVGARGQVGHFEGSGKPFVPAAIVIEFESRIAEEVAVKKREQSERSGMDGIGGVDGADFVKVQPAGAE